jgi:putative oxidoreductase
MQKLASTLMLIGRILFAILFLFSGIYKLIYFNIFLPGLVEKNVPLPYYALWIAAIIEILGGLALLVGWKVRCVAIILILYLIPVTIIMHDFWTAAGADWFTQQFHFFKNVAIIGGLLYIVACGGGLLSCDTCSKTRPA